MLALKNTAKYYLNGKVVEVAGRELMKSAEIKDIYPALNICGYGNRDSTSYKERYNIPEAHTIIRGTLRYQGWPEIAQALNDIGLLDDSDHSKLKKGCPDLSWASLLADLIGSQAKDEK